MWRKIAEVAKDNMREGGAWGTPAAGGVGTTSASPLGLGKFPFTLFLLELEGHTGFLSKTRFSFWFPTI